MSLYVTSHAKMLLPLNFKTESELLWAIAYQAGTKPITIYHLCKRLSRSTFYL